MKLMKSTGIVLMCLIILILSLVPEQVYASGGFEGLFPTEGEMGYPCSGGNDSDMSECNEFTGYEYKKYPSGHYGWDTVHVWFRLRGIIPEMGNVDELMISSIAGFWNGINIILTRFAIFFLQFGFARGELFTKPLLEIDSTLQPIKYYVYDNLFFLAALGLAIIVVVLYARGRIGEAYGAIFKAVFVSAIMMLIVDNASFVVLTIWNMVDFVTLTVLGLVNLSPVHMESSVWVAQSKIVEISNTIFSIYVDQPWSFGQFNSMEAPTITYDEKELLRKSEVYIDSINNWKEAMLDYPAKSDERVVMVEVLTNNEISHDGSLDTTMLERGGLTRILIAFTSSLLAVSGFILFGATSLLQVLSNIGILILLIFLGSMIIFSFFNDLGLRIIYKYAGFTVWILCLKIAAAIFIGIPMLVFQLLNLSGIKYLLASSLHIFVNILAIVFLPFIWKKMTPALVSGAVKVSQSMVSGGAATTGAGGGDRRTMPPEIRTESQRGNFEQAKWYRERKQSREKQKEAKVQEQEIVTEIPKIKSKQNQASIEDVHNQTTTNDSSSVEQTEQPVNNTTPYRTARKQKTTEQTEEKVVSSEESQKKRENRKKIIDDLASNPRKIKTKGFPKNKA